MEIQKYYHNEPIFNGVYSRNNLSEKRMGAYIINLVIAENVTYFDNFGVKYIPKEIRKFIKIQ